MTPVLAFDIETVPDCAGIRRLYDLPDSLADAEVAEVAFQKRRAQSGNDFLPPHLHKVVVISCVLREGEEIKVFSLSGTEKETIQRFYDGVEKYVPQLVSWNGGGFDLPVLNYRALANGVSAPKFWDQGEDDRDFKWNSYLGRYHARHLDLMDVLAMYQPRNKAPLDAVARIAGFPGKIGVGGAEVWPAYQAGKLAEIRDYCEADCANTYLLYLRFQLLRGAFTAKACEHECGLLRGWMEKQKAPHWREFLSLWREPKLA
ncbi:MAG: 3'-5' exonuclease [Betaproteobacteria bacterium]|nr:3'-5' exonuclease [Betaproteobacteria bacterium]